MLLLVSPPLKCKFLVGRHFSVFFFLLNPQLLEHCLRQSRYTINNFWMENEMGLGKVGLRKVRLTSFLQNFSQPLLQEYVSRFSEMGCGVWQHFPWMIINVSRHITVQNTMHEAFKFSILFFQWGNWDLGGWGTYPGFQSHSLGWNLKSADIQTIALSTSLFLRHH